MRAAAASRARLGEKHLYAIWYRNNDKSRGDKSPHSMGEVVLGRVERDPSADEGEGVERVYLHNNSLDDVPLKDMLCSGRDGASFEFALARKPRSEDEASRRGRCTEGWRVIAKASIPYKDLDTKHKVDDWTNEDDIRTVEYDFGTESGVGVSMVAWQDTDHPKDGLLITDMIVDVPVSALHDGDDTGLELLTEY